jgi:hypothetical protein
VNDNDPIVLEWFEKVREPESSDDFIESVMDRVHSSHRGILLLATAAALTTSSTIWIYRDLLGPIGAHLVQAFVTLSALITSPLTWALSLTVLAAAWSVARCREWDV